MLKVSQLPAPRVRRDISKLQASTPLAVRLGVGVGDAKSSGRPACSGEVLGLREGLSITQES